MSFFASTSKYFILFAFCLSFCFSQLGFTALFEAQRKAVETHRAAAQSIIAKYSTQSPYYPDVTVCSTLCSLCCCPCLAPCIVCSTISEVCTFPSTRQARWKFNSRQGLLEWKKSLRGLDLSDPKRQSYFQEYSQYLKGIRYERSVTSEELFENEDDFKAFSQLQ